jgi:LysM domain
MSLATVNPSTANRTARRGRQPVLRGSSAVSPSQSHLRLVQGQPGAAPIGRPARAPGSAAVRSAPEAPGQLRLTRRGRIVVRVGSAVLALLMVGSGVLLLDRTAQAGSQPHPVPVSYRVVLPGETLWQIAGEVAPRADRRDTVARIVELNALPGAGVSAGQRIAIPASTS